MEIKQAETVSHISHPSGSYPSRSHLESLTTPELIKLADSSGIDIPPGLDRIFIIEELLDFFTMDEEEIPNESDLQDIVLLESAPLPKQYNITFIEVMIRDPLWAFVFWEVKSQDKEQFEKLDTFDGYYLKVSPIPFIPEGVFTVPLGNNDTTRYISFNPDISPGSNTGSNPKTLDQSRYKVELCAGIDGEETILAASDPVILPGLPEHPTESDKKLMEGALSNPLNRLSGYGDFSVIRKNERLFRIKRS